MRVAGDADVRRRGDRKQKTLAIRTAAQRCRDKRDSRAVARLQSWKGRRPTVDRDPIGRLGPEGQPVFCGIAVELKPDRVALTNVRVVGFAHLGHGGESTLGPEHAGKRRVSRLRVRIGSNCVEATRFHPPHPETLPLQGAGGQGSALRPCAVEQKGYPETVGVGRRGGG